MNDKCFECESTENLIDHHVVPESRGGTKTLKLCQICHGKAHHYKSPRNISISELSREGLVRAKARGIKLGNPKYKNALPLAIAARQKIANNKNDKIIPIIEEIQRDLNLHKLQEISDELNRREIKTNRGSLFTPTHIHRLFKWKSLNINNVGLDIH